ncbi:MAG: hypothetical protein GY772_19190 [bacterium]|nr:hypothetical protein [bacterium]
MTELAHAAAAEVSEMTREHVCHAAQGVGPPVKDDLGTRILLCTASFCRGHQLLRALPINLVTMQRYRGLVTWVIVCFEDSSGDSDRITQWVRENGEEAIAAGLLVFKVGVGMNFWHASYGKNTSHRVAVESLGPNPPPRVALVNLDNDNLPGKDFIPAVMAEALAPRRAQLPVCMLFSGMSGTVGRMVYWARDFFRIGGYDQSFEPMGFQDIDLRDRLAEMLKRQGGQVVKRFAGDHITGEAIPNHSCPKLARGEYKLRYCSPTARQSTWGAMNTRNRLLGMRLLREGKLDRNLGDGAFGMAVIDPMLPRPSPLPLPPSRRNLPQWLQLPPPEPAGAPPANRQQPPGPPPTPTLTIRRLPPPLVVSAAAAATAAPAARTTTYEPIGAPPPPMPPTVAVAPPPPMPRTAGAPVSLRPAIGAQPPRVSQAIGALPPAVTVRVSVTASRPMTVTVMSLGLKVPLAGGRHGAEPIEQDCHLSARELVEVTARRLRQVPRLAIDPRARILSFDVRKFRDPYAESHGEDLRGHVGVNPEIIRRFVDAPRFLEWVQFIKGLVVPALDRGRENPPVIVFCCNKGRHRSVAATVVISHVLEFEGYVVERVHLMRDTWMRGTCEGTCPACASRSDRRSEALAKAVRLWRAAP